MEKALMYIRLLKYDLEYLVRLLEELEKSTNSSCSLLINRAANIIEYSINSTLKEGGGTIENVKWVADAITSYLRNHPDNIFGSNDIFLDKRIDHLYWDIFKLNEEVYKYL